MLPSCSFFLEPVEAPCAIFQCTVGKVHYSFIHTVSVGFVTCARSICPSFTPFLLALSPVAYNLGAMEDSSW
jgi:hypothetical protein